MTEVVYGVQTKLLMELVEQAKETNKLLAKINRGVRLRASTTANEDADDSTDD